MRSFDVGETRCVRYVSAVVYVVLLKVAVVVLVRIVMGVVYPYFVGLQLTVRLSLFLVWLVVRKLP